MTDNWTFEWITDWNTIWSDDFIKQWQSWLKQSWSSHVFFHPSLAKAWVATYMPLRNISPLFLIAKYNGMIVFLPLVLWKRNWKNAFLSEIIPVGYADFDYHDPIIVGKKELFDPDVFWTKILQELDTLTVAYNSINITGIRTEHTGSGEYWQKDEPCPYCDISEFTNSEIFLPTLKSSLRGDLRRQIRRLQERGKLTYHVYSPDELQESLKTLPTFLTFHANRWPNAYKAPYFHENLLRFGIPAGVIHFSELRLDGKAISWHLGFIDTQRFYYYLPALNPTFSILSPGKVHLLKCVEEAISLKLSIYDHLRGEEAYKSGWTDKVEHLSNFGRIKNNTSSNIKFFLVKQVRPLIERYIHK